jgi:hypothetical protein
MLVTRSEEFCAVCLIVCDLEVSKRGVLGLSWPITSQKELKLCQTTSFRIHSSLLFILSLVV